LPEDQCCRSPETRCPCGCGDVLEYDPKPMAVLLRTMPNLTSDWSIVSICPVGFDTASRVPTFLESTRTSFFFHVPLHVLLCVFLN
jgi:hypothetical protein